MGESSQNWERFSLATWTPRLPQTTRHFEGRKLSEGTHEVLRESQTRGERQWLQQWCAGKALRIHSGESPGASPLHIFTVWTLPPWPISSYQCDIAESRAGKRRAQWALESQCEVAPAPARPPRNECGRLGSSRKSGSSHSHSIFDICNMPHFLFTNVLNVKGKDYLSPTFPAFQGVWTPKRMCLDSSKRYRKGWENIWGRRRDEVACVEKRTLGKEQRCLKEFVCFFFKVCCVVCNIIIQISLRSLQ